jgi:polysaccharide deacetylase family protein (PEP-CTERM system associated)
VTKGATAAGGPNARKPLALSFDVECYYQVVAKDFLGRAIKPTTEVVRNTNWILDLLKENSAKATFFFLGNVAENYPALVRRAVDEGHEIGVHGDVHDYVSDMDQAQFRSEIERGMSKIRAAGADRIAGHRATAFSISRKNLWALDTLHDLGVAYDSSIFPFEGGRYGIADWPRRPSATEAGIVEVPMSVVSVAGRKIPCMGGGYVRYFPMAFTRWCASRLHREGLTPVCYFHPYEFEDRKPQFDSSMLDGAEPGKVSRLAKFNRMQGIGRGRKMRRKLEWLVKNYEVVPVGALAR